jgi:hypothetical protein
MIALESEMSRTSTARRAEMAELERQAAIEYNAPSGPSRRWC